ncbi:MAG: hypothetical protein OEQ74_00970, partial [Gammaproteobacteria bacterium]|nr:hypothetical protein [Gammaproteobacteria bacterium]
MRISLYIVALIAVMALLAGPLPADEPEATGLEMELHLGERSVEKLADGTASMGESRLAIEPTAAPPESSLTAILVGALALALAAFGAGALVARRNVPESKAEPPVALWLDGEKLQGELQVREAELEKQQIHTEEIVAEREQLLLLHADQVHELRGEKEELERELQAMRLRGGDDTATADLQATVDSLRAEIESLRGADDETRDRRELPGDDGEPELRTQLDKQQAHIEQLEELLRSAHDESQVFESRAVKLESIESKLAHREQELETATQELAQLREKAELLDEKEGRVAVLDQELSALRDEMNQLLGKTGQYQMLVPELETKLFHHQEQIGALESDLQATTNEVIERDRDASQLEDKVSTLQDALDQAEARVASMEADLASVIEENNLLRLDPDTEQLHHENIDLNKTVREAEAEMAELRARYEEVQLHQAHADEWNSTVSSLQAEIRRKSTLIDSQADHLAVRAKDVADFKAEIDDLREQLAARSNESESLRGLLAEAGDVVVSLRDEIGQDEHAATRMRLARDPAQDPYGNDADAVDPVEADIEALRFTARGRRDLGDSLEAILNEERSAMEQASRRVSDRDEELIALKNEISANRVTMVVMQNRLHDVNNNSDVAVNPGMEPARVEQELQQSMKVLEALRADLHKWRGRVKPLHAALVERNKRIQYLEDELTVLRQAQGL